MPKISEERRESRRDQIVTATLACIRRNGFERTSMNDIITESNLSAGAIYGHFKGKADILQFAAERVLGQRLDLLEDVTERTPLPRPTAVAEVLIRGLLARADGIGRIVLQAWASSTIEPALHEMVSDAFEAITDIVVPYLQRWYIALGAAPAAARTFARERCPILLAFVQGSLVQSALLAEKFDLERYLQVMSEVEFTLPVAQCGRAASA